VSQVQARYPVPQQPQVFGLPSVKLRLTPQAAPPTRFLIQGKFQPDYVPGPEGIFFRLTPSAASPAPPTRFLLQGLPQLPYVAGLPGVFITLAPAPPIPRIFVVSGVVQPTAAVVGQPQVITVRPVSAAGPSLALQFLYWP
jgi:hypothetical protein